MSSPKPNVENTSIWVESIFLFSWGTRVLEVWSCLCSDVEYESDNEFDEDFEQIELFNDEDNVINTTSSFEDI